MKISPPATPSTTSQSTATTLAAALAAVDTWTDLLPARRSLLKHSLLSIADMLGDPPTLIVLTPDFIRARLRTPAPAAFGISDGTMRNRLSHLCKVMERMELIDACRAPRSPAWVALLGPLTSRQKAPLAKLVDFATLRGIGPEEITYDNFTEFSAWLTTRTLIANPKKLAGSCRRAWNGFAAKVAGWPAVQLAAPPGPHQYILPWDRFTPTFRTNSERFGERLTGKSAPFKPGARSVHARPFKANSKTNRRSNRGVGLRKISADGRVDHLRWAASALVASGEVAITEINKVTDLVEPPDRAHAIMKFLDQLRGSVPNANALRVLEVLLILAKYEAKLPEEEIEDLRSWREDVEPEMSGMSARRRDRILAAMEPARLQALLQLPTTCMDQALTLLAESPQNAVALAMRAVAVQMFLMTQLRLYNVITLKVGQHLQSHDPARRRYQRLDIAAQEVKNSNAITRPIDSATRSMIDLWVRHFRPLLASDAEGYLFPGRGTPHITRQGMRDAVKSITKQIVGVALGPHDFRGLAGEIFLRCNPGDYGTLMNLLGHKSIATTMNSYTANEVARAVDEFDRTILRLSRGEMRKPGPTRKGPPKPPRPPRPPSGGKGPRGRGRR